MNRNLVLAIVFSCLTAIFAFLYLNELESDYKRMSEPVRVVVAAKRIAQGTVISPDSVVVKKVPKEFAQPKVFSDIKSMFTADGKSLYIALNPIEPDEQILATKVSLAGLDTGLSNIIPDGKRALPVKFDSSISQALTPGTKTDILCVIEYADANKQIIDATVVVAQDILVLACGSNYLGGAKRQASDDSIEAANYAVLSVSMEEAQKILLADERGKLKFVIRPAGDDGDLAVKIVKISDIGKDISKAQQAPSPSAAPSSQKEAMEFINKYVGSAAK